MTEPTTSSDPLTPPIEALYWTQYGIWYPIFRKHAPKSTIIEIDSVQPELLSWLDSETFVLPEGSGPSTLPHNRTASASSELSDEEDEDEQEEEQEVVKLEKLDAKIREVVEKYDGGPLFPKLNWSAPLDAGFMLPGNNLQCLHPEDVYLLLKSSEFVGRDLEQISQLSSTNPAETTTHTEAQESDSLQLPTTSPSSSNISKEKPIRPQLILKKWFTFARSHEFRCFVRSNHLIAISQRDVTFYDHLQSSLLQYQIKGVIWDFWEDVLLPARREGKWAVRDYVFDVYLTKDLGRVWLVDMNGWLPRTDTLLWSFDELEEMHKREKALRRRDRGETAVGEGLEDRVVRLRIASTDNTVEKEDEGEGEDWSESDVELRVLSDRRMQSSGGTGATYSSNMVPKDLVDFAKTSSSASASGGVSGGMGVDQIVQRWNDSIDAEEASSQA